MAATIQKLQHVFKKNDRNLHTSGIQNRIYRKMSEENITKHKIFDNTHSIE